MLGNEIRDSQKGCTMEAIYVLAARCNVYHSTSDRVVGIGRHTSGSKPCCCPILEVGIVRLAVRGLHGTMWNVAARHDPNYSVGSGDRGPGALTRAPRVI